MKIFAKLNQVCSEYNGGFFNISDFDGVAIGVWGIPDETFLFSEKEGSYKGYHVISTSNIDDFIEYIKEREPRFLEKYELVGNMKELFNAR